MYTLVKLSLKGSFKCPTQLNDTVTLTFLHVIGGSQPFSDNSDPFVCHNFGVPGQEKRHHHTYHHHSTSRCRSENSEIRCLENVETNLNCSSLSRRSLPLLDIMSSGPLWYSGQLSIVWCQHVMFVCFFLYVKHFVTLLLKSAIQINSCLCINKALNCQLAYWLYCKQWMI